MRHYEGDGRYQFQPGYVRLARWLRHMPLAYAAMVWRFTVWVLAGARPAPGWPGGRRGAARAICMCARSQAAMRMGHWWTTEECLAHARGED